MKWADEPVVCGHREIKRLTYNLFSSSSSTTISFIPYQKNVPIPVALLALGLLQRLILIQFQYNLNHLRLETKIKIR